MQAILILAHTDVPHIMRLVDQMQDFFKIYIHFDKKMELKIEYMNQLTQDGVYFIQEIDVKWGTWTQVEATQLLMRQAMLDPHIEYVHLISGQDYPVIAPEDIYAFYHNNNSIYLRTLVADSIVKSGEPIIWWQKYYFDYSRVNRKSIFGKIYHRLSIIVQTLMRIDKFKHFGFNETLFHGSCWAALPRDAVTYLLSKFDGDSLYKEIFETGFCPDEFWMQTILGNEEEFQKRIIGENYRYIKWKKKHNSYPAILDMNDYEEIISSETHFARKLTSFHSEELMDKLDLRR